MRSHILTAALIFGFLSGFCSIPSRASDPIQVFSLRPVTSHGCVAVRIQLAEGQTLAGLSWFHNDGTVPFPRLLLMEAGESPVPDLTQTGLILRDLTGEELGWGEVTFESPVVSSTGEVFAVFVYPDLMSTTGLGDGGGPGIGLSPDDGGCPFLLSPDGVSWVRYSEGSRLAIQPQFGSIAARGSAGAVVLGSLVDGVGYDAGASLQTESAVPPLRANALYPPSPNPFNPRTTIRFDLVQSSKVRIRVYDVRGRRIKTLVDAVRPGGRNLLTWDGDDQRGASVASGVYFLRMEIANEEFVERMTLVR